MHQSVPSTNIPPGQTPGEFVDVIKSPAAGQIFLQKHGAADKKHLPLGSILEDLVNLSC